MSSPLILIFTLFITSIHHIYANTFVMVNTPGDVIDVEYHLALYSPQLSTTTAYLSIPIQSATACDITQFPTNNFQRNGETYTGSVLVVEEKDCDIMQQADVAQRIGVIGLIIISSTSSHIISTPIPPSFTLTIPLLSISKHDGMQIQTYLNFSGNLVVWEMTNGPTQIPTTQTPTPSGTVSSGTTTTPTTQIPTPSGTVSAGTTKTPTTQTPTTQIPTTKIPTTQIPTTQIPTTLPPISSTGSISSSSQGSTGISRSSTAIPTNHASTCIPSIFILLLTIFCHAY